jgi:hypothetical protein
MLSTFLSVYNEASNAIFKVRLAPSCKAWRILCRCRHKLRSPTGFSTHANTEMNQIADDK